MGRGGGGGGGGGGAVNITVVVEGDDVLCGEGMHSTVCVCVLVDKSIRDGTGRGDPCDSQ